MSVEPKSIIAGDSLEWTRDSDDCQFLDIDGNSTYRSATESTLEYYFRNASAAYKITASATDADFEVSVAASVTSAYSTGIYNWSAFLSFTTGAVSKRYQVDSGTWEVLPNMASTAVYDGRSHVKKVLDALEALILGKAGADNVSYSIGGRSITKMPPGDLLKWHSHYSWLYKQEQAAENINNEVNTGSKILTRFV